jgi:TolB-like protein
VTGPTEQGNDNLWTRLRSRKVAQWGLAYVAAAWALLEGIGFFADTFHWPEISKQLAALALIAGLPIAVTLAWYHGERGQQRPTRSEFAILALLLLVTGSMLWFFGHRAVPTTGTTAATGADVPAVQVSADSRPSIAVLPFVNRSNLEDDAFFVDGIHEDILTRLSKIGSLTVIARTSVERFRGTTLPVKEIAGQLGVRVVLEGSVQRAGNRVRVNVQLIDAATERHLWADTYDRELTIANIFAIQTEVATAIAGALSAALTPNEESRLSKIPTQSLEAWKRYQLGRQRLAHRTGQSMREAVELFREAIAIDPQFALAYAAVSETFVALTDGHGPEEPATSQAKEAVAHALALDPNLPEGLLMHAWLYKSCDDPTQTDMNFQRALELDPSSGWGHFYYARAKLDCGRWSSALAYLERAAQLDPLSIGVHTLLSETLASEGHFDEALMHAQRVIQIDPSHRVGYQLAGSYLAYLQGEVGWGISFYHRAAQIDPQRRMTQIRLGMMYMDLGDLESAERHLTIVRDLTGDSEGRSSAYALTVAALVRLQQGARTEAIQLLERAVAIDQEPGYPILAALEAKAGDLDGARRRMVEQRPELLPPGIWIRTSASRQRAFGCDISYALLLAAILQRSGETEQAMRLVDEWESVLPEMARLGLAGYWLADVEIFAMRGQTDKALAALRQAVDEGWRGPWWRFQMDWLETFENLRGRPELEAIRAEIEADMARQRAELEARTGQLPTDLTQFIERPGNKPAIRDSGWAR